MTSFSRVREIQSTFCREKSVDKPLVLCMVGLPARGKTFTARKLERYLRWVGFRTKTFNIGCYRRKIVGAQKDSDFFDPDNRAGVQQRTACAVAALDDLFNWITTEGQIAIYDGTNSTLSRRNMVKQYFQERSNDEFQVHLVWIECICENEAILEANIRETKLSSPDYIDTNAQDAVNDFRARISNYEKSYETLNDNLDSFIKLIDAGRQVLVNRVEGYALGRIVHFLMNLRINTCPILLTRHGGSPFGGDSPLNDRGKRFANAISAFIDSNFPQFQRIEVFCSTFRRAIETASAIHRSSTVCWRALTEIEVGAGAPIIGDEDFHQDGECFLATSDALSRRYPTGESLDVIQRLEPIIFELEKTTVPLIILADRAALRSIYAYFVDVPVDETPPLDSFVNSVFKLTSKAYGCEVESFELNVGSGGDYSADHSKKESIV